MKLELPDGACLEVPDGATGADAAAAIGPGLARAALAIKVNGEVRDLARPLPDGAAPHRIEVLTDRSGEEALAVIRHDCAHVLATAVMELYPGVKISIGPAIEDGFYYDFDFPEGVSLSDADFEAIEARMRRHIEADEPFERQDVPVGEALERFRSEGQDYKVRLIEDLVREQGVETVSLYTNGPFTDLCRGPHAPSTGRIRAFKLQSVAGAYWRGDSSQPMLTRVYGTAFFSRSELEQHLERLERARANDHRRLGPQLGLFAFSEVSPGAAFWLPAGTEVFNALVSLSREMGRERRYLEPGLLHRREPSGTLHGLLRVRHFAQDDSHIFCTEEQIQDEVAAAIEFAFATYRIFGLDVRLELSTRPEVRLGSDALWDRSEAALMEALESQGLAYDLNPGDGAFYGPKVDMHMTDSLGRSWQLGTVQLDYNMPQRFDLAYTGADNAEHRPVMIHRALMGSYERFIGILIEHFAGELPLWLAPVQAIVLPIADRHLEYAGSVVGRLRAGGLRAELDRRGESIAHKIREAELRKIPYLLVVGDREAESLPDRPQVSVREHHGGERGAMPLEELIGELAERVRSRSIG